MFILSIGRSYSEDQFIFPKEKPSIFKKVDKNSSPSSCIFLTTHINTNILKILDDNELKQIKSNFKKFLRIITRSKSFN